MRKNSLILNGDHAVCDSASRGTTIQFAWATVGWETAVTTGENVQSRHNQQQPAPATT